MNSVALSHLQGSSHESFASFNLNLLVFTQAQPDVLTLKPYESYWVAIDNPVHVEGF